MGLTRLGVELTFPLSPSLLVAIWDYRYFGKYKDFDGCFGKVTDDYLKDVILQDSVKLKNMFFV